MSAIALENVKNLRDVATASSSVQVVPLKIFRTGCISKASDADVRSSPHTVSASLPAAQRH